MKLSTRRSLVLGLGLSLAAMGAALLAPTQLPASSGNGQGIFGDDNRGDNPVVGSLPCRRDPYLQPMFWAALYNEAPHIDLFGFEATLAFVGDSLLEDILDAGGEPQGRVDSWPDVHVFGVHKWASVFLSTVSVRQGRVGLWYWVPREYVGGTISLQSNFGTFQLVITEQAFELPLQGFANRCTSSFGVAKVVIEPPARAIGMDVKEVLVAVAGATVNVQHLP